MPYHNSGGHFIIWSLYFLTGQQYCISEAGSIVPVVAEFDGDSINFHHQSLLKVSGLDECKSVVNQLQNDSTTPPVVNIYLLPKSSSNIYKDIIDQYGKVTPEHVNMLRTIELDDTVAMLDWIHSNRYPLLFVEYHQSDILNSFYNDRQPLSILENQYVGSLHKKYATWEDLFYKGTAEQFENNVWDYREKLSLIIKPFDTVKFAKCLNKKLPHLSYNTDDIWNNFDALIPEMCEFLKVTVVPERLDIWKSIYNEWRVKHDPYFSRHFDRIINAIVQGDYMSLTRFNLTFFHEALIQHALITRHNLNFKTWQLTKLPDNTQEIHKLLEPNIHTI